MQKWYKDGIIDPEVFTRKANTARQTLWTKENTGGFTHEWLASTSSYNDNKELLTTVPNFKVEAMLPVNANGKAFEEHQRILAKPDGWAISSNCNDPVAAIKLFDWFYSPEGRIAINYGIEGKTYTMVNGKPQFTDEVLKSGTVNTYLQKNYGAQFTVGYQQDYEYERQWTNEAGQAAYDLYANADIHSAKDTPILNLNEDEKATYDKYVTNLNTFLNEKVTAFIVGKEDIDANWDSYVKQANELGAEEIVKVYQSAYDRYKQQ